MEKADLTLPVSIGSLNFTDTPVIMGMFSSPSDGEVWITLNGRVANEKVNGEESESPLRARNEVPILTAYVVPMEKPAWGANSMYVAPEVVKTCPGMLGRIENADRMVLAEILLLKYT
jgi:hypothetical protein